MVEISTKDWGGVVQSKKNLNQKTPLLGNGGRPIFKFKYLCIGSTYSRKQNSFKIVIFISSLILDNQALE